MLAGLSGSFPVDASPPRTGAVATAGGRTQAGPLGAAVVIVLLIPFAGILKDVPLATLAAILIFVAGRLFNLHDLSAIARFNLLEFALALITLLTVALVGVEQGIAVAVVLAMLDRIRKSAQSQLAVLGRVAGTTSWTPLAADPDAAQQTGVLAVLFATPLWYANATHFREQMADAVARAPGTTRIVVLDAIGMADVDFTGARALGRVLDACGTQPHGVRRGPGERPPARDAAAQRAARAHRRGAVLLHGERGGDHLGRRPGGAARLKRRRLARSRSPSARRNVRGRVGRVGRGLGRGWHSPSRPRPGASDADPTIGYTSTESMPAATRAAAFCGFIRCSSTPSVVMTTMRGRPVADMTAKPASLAFAHDAAEEGPRRQAPGEEEEQGEQRDEQEHLGLVDQRVQVERDAALDEEDRDQEAEPDGLELARDPFAVLPLDEEAGRPPRPRRRRAGRRDSA